MKKAQFSMDGLLAQLESTTTSLKEQITAIKKDIDSLDEFLVEHRKLVREQSDLDGQQQPDIKS